MADLIFRSDPDNIPVRVVNAVTAVVVTGGAIHLELATARVKPLPDGKIEPDYVVAARLRFNLEMARVLRDTINKQIALLTPPDSKAN
jgi:hypothetical protein